MKTDLHVQRGSEAMNEAHRPDRRSGASVTDVALQPLRHDT
jgi:hypothetical protein